MKLQFDKNQLYQIEAIHSIVDLFEGQSLSKSDFEFSITDATIGSLQYSEAGVGNKLTLSKTELLNNLIKVQTYNELGLEEISSAIEQLWYNEDSEIKGIVEGKTVVT